MLHRRVRGLALLGFGFAFACSSSSSSSDAPADRRADRVARSLESYVNDAGVRRRALETSLVNPANAYARLRLDNYRDKDAWGALPELNPPTTPILPGQVGEPGAGAVWTKVDLEGDVRGSSADDLHKLGEYAFYNYPVQVAAPLPIALARPNRSGIWEHEGRLGAVWVNLAGGIITTALTCGSCHASVGDHGELVAGRNNAAIDAAVMMAGDGERGPAWGLGKVDVTSDAVDDPVAITDLRPIRYQQNLHHAATLRNDDPVALAVRIETLIITSHNGSVRPPRKIAAALAAFLLDLAPDRELPASDSVGARVFDRECSRCHGGEGRAGAPVSLATVGTNPLVGESGDRGTGAYRVPSLRSVGDRHRLFASGEVEDIVDLLTPPSSSPERAAKGHVFGLTLDPTDRTALLEYLRAL